MHPAAESTVFQKVSEKAWSIAVFPQVFEIADQRVWEGLQAGRHFKRAEFVLERQHASCARAAKSCLTHMADYIPVVAPVGITKHGDICAEDLLDRKSTRLNSSHGYISYAVFCLKKKKR